VKGSSSIRPLDSSGQIGGKPAPGGDDQTGTFTESELANNNLLTIAADGDSITRHRNFFSVVYSPNGELVVGRDVLIADKDEDKNLLGDITGLSVGDPTAVKQYYMRSTTTPTAPAPTKRRVIRGGGSRSENSAGCV
jgi:hypothetical protein